MITGLGFGLEDTGLGFALASKRTGLGLGLGLEENLPWPWPRRLLALALASNMLSSNPSLPDGHVCRTVYLVSYLVNEAFLLFIKSRGLNPTQGNQVEDKKHHSDYTHRHKHQRKRDHVDIK